MAEQTFKEACTRAADMRQEHIKNLSKALAEKNNTSEEAEMKKLTHIANQRKRARRIRRATKKPSKGLATNYWKGLLTAMQQWTHKRTSSELVHVKIAQGSLGASNARSCMVNS